jgi:hypothetical protein
MEYSDIEKLISILGGLGIGAILGGGIIYLLIKNFIPSYLSEKAKNLASKEDIEFITDKVESVKSDYAHLIEEIRSGHQLKLAAIEREKNTKKEVYMEAAESLTRCQNIITRFCNLNLSEEQITSNMHNDSGKIAKVHVVGGKETVKAVTTFMAETGKAFLDLTLKRSELTLRKNSIETHEFLRDKAQQEIDRHKTYIKNFNLEGNTDQSLWATVNSSIEFEQGQHEIHQAKIDILWGIQSTEYLKFTRECMSKYFEISMLLPPAVLAIRNELDLNIASEDYLDIFNANIEEGRQVFDLFFQRIEQNNN